MSARPSSGFAACLLGCEVLGRTDDHVGAGLVRVAAQRARDPEVGDYGVAVGVEEDVVHLDVAVDHALAMRVAERLRDVYADADDELFRKAG